ncbi:DUF3500 domain-containing protein [Pedobacter frigidisoli]|uniref:DUF3500 domain-containing protein n=1 Tax=Pedobacter frigidisoli TaxID=2530455 RepID=UPI00292E67F7|nr:DUF3500 domain-containing protein [Pedobacter frigidisoli]
MKSKIYLLFLLVALGACKKSTSTSSGGTTTSSASVTALNCSAASFSALATVNVAYSGTATVGYTGGNAVAYTAGTAISSTGVTGLTATLVAGTLASGAGNLSYTITGTPTTTGTATFPVTFGGQTCSFALTVSAATTSTCTGTQIEQLVCAANTFLGSLSTSQQASTVLAYSQTNAIKWSNLPCGSSCRVGIQFSTLSAAQLAYAKLVVAKAMGTQSGTGYSQVMQILAADDVLGTQQSGYSSGTYFISFLGTPSTTGTWQLQFGGHHLAVNLTFKAGVVAGASPFFIGVEPKTWTSSGTTYAPLAANQSAMLAILSSMSTTELATAKLSATFSDVLLGPGSDGKFPASKLGIKASTLTTAQKTLILNAIKLWVQNVDDASATSLLSTYTTELDNTYISYSGNTTLANNADYIRIDGPSVWIEFVCQSGVVYKNEIHYHSVYRDHTRDYGGSFSF